jgi:ABC-type uncharacterized transport system substrate-binding protein
MRRVGVLMSTASNDPQELQFVAAFSDALAKAGWSPGRDVELVIRWGAGDVARMVANARELVALSPDVMLVKGANLRAAASATSSMPIVFVMLSDAAAENVVGSFARPKANVTGFTSYERELVGKRLQLLRELSPGLRKALYVRSRLTGADTSGLSERLKENAVSLGIQIVDAAADDDTDIQRAFQSFGTERDGGVIVAFDAFTVVHQARIIELAVRGRLPAIYPLRVFMHAGGLMSYGLDQEDQFRQAATYVARILAGEKPSALPVQAPTKFQLVINRTAAKNLGLTVPQSLLLSADEVIE